MRHRVARLRARLRAWRRSYRLGRVAGWNGVWLFDQPAPHHGLTGYLWRLGWRDGDAQRWHAPYESPRRGGTR